MQLETIRVNVLGMLNLADICYEKKIHLTTYPTGCIFHNDKDFPDGSGKFVHRYATSDAVWASQTSSNRFVYRHATPYAVPPI